MPHSRQPDEAEWFEQQVRSHERELRAYLQRRYPDARDVDDVIQESYLRRLRARQTSRIESAKAYLFTTARNVVLALFRRPRIFSEQSVTEFPASCIPEEGVDVAEIVSNQQEIACLLEAIDALPSRCRQVFVLRKLHGLSQKAIAAQLGLSPQTVQVQIARGARKCAAYLRARGVTGRTGIEPEQ